MVTFATIILQYVCPSMGCVMASLMFAAPIHDLRQALLKGSLGPLNPFPWAMMTGNCLGWVVYGYYTKDPFVVAANIPGLVLSLWLNTGAAKLQYLELSDARKRFQRQQQAQWDASPANDDEEMMEVVPLNLDAAALDEAQNFVTVPQERALLRVLVTWVSVIIWAGWFAPQDPASIVGVVVNINLVFFYGAPLQMMFTVISQKNSESIHVPTMIMNWINTSFWIAYGITRQDVVIILPNTIGLFLGLLQGLLRGLYPSKPNHSEQAEETPEEEVVISGNQSNHGEVVLDRSNQAL